MTDQEINIAIAEWCDTSYNPDYCNDLNAMHEAEMPLSAAQQLRYAELLLSMFKGQRHYLHKDYDVLHATARQRAEALLRTIGKWKE